MQKNNRGMLFLFTGNPGAGKDSVIKKLSQEWKNQKQLYVPKRTITRPAHDSEDYNSVTKNEFTDLLKKDEFLFHWESYGIFYGLPNEIKDRLSEGKIVAVNVSRDAVSEIKEKIPGTKCIYINIDPETGVKRIKKRGREKNDSSEFQERKNKLFSKSKFKDPDFTADNSFELSRTVKEVENYISSLIEP